MILQEIPHDHIFEYFATMQWRTDGERNVKPKVVYVYIIVNETS